MLAPILSVLCGGGKVNQITIFDLIEENEPFTCDSCRYNEKGCCSYNEPLGRYCVMGNAYEKAAPVFPGCDFSEVVEYINKRLNVNFQKLKGCSDGSDYYEYKPSQKVRLTLSKGKFFPEICEGREYIGVGFNSTKDGYSGASAPLDSVEEAIQWFEKHR